MKLYYKLIVMELQQMFRNHISITCQHNDFMYVGQSVYKFHNRQTKQHFIVFCTLGNDK